MELEILVELVIALVVLLIFILAVFVVAMYGFLKVTEILIRPDSVTYTTKQMTDDWMSMNVKARASLAHLQQINPRAVLHIVLDVLEEVEFDLARQNETADRIRKGTWHKEMPGTKSSPQNDSTRDNGDP